MSNPKSKNLYKQQLDRLNDIDPNLPHGSNLKTKLLSGKQSVVLSSIADAYLNFLNGINNITTTDQTEWLKQSLSIFENYYAFLKAPENKKFSHQSDFLSSLLPELLYLSYSKIIQSAHSDLEITTQKDIIIDLSFLPYNDSSITFKPKRVDVAIVKKLDVTIGGEALDFSIPIVALEVKTNLDKNMISGVEYSVERLKRTFPLCKFYLVSELADFAYEKQNYAGTAIDEIIILRKQKRSVVRKNPKGINNVDLGLFESHINDIHEFLNSNVVTPSNLKERLSTGRLIN
ncbi:Bpu10I family restriction endonuclease [Marinoscillum sp. 108]|uniref:Bpu10I family restriction endonuclease n=1 Tax=Marinoscillum sp. 108 TaxID=2653151 RepID=UPI00135BB948|nr:Bpu10I family restriction endonuclease [Marinoscillum sp. 108]